MKRPKYTVAMFRRDIVRYGDLRLLVRLSDGGAIEIDLPLLNDLMANRNISDRTPPGQAAPFVLTVPHQGFVVLTRNEWAPNKHKYTMSVEEKRERLRQFMGFKKPSKSTGERNQSMTSMQLLAKFEAMKKQAAARYPPETGATPELIEGYAIEYLMPTTSQADMQRLLEATGNPALQAAMAPMSHLGGVFA